MLPFGHHSFINVRQWSVCVWGGGGGDIGMALPFRMYGQIADQI